MVVSDATLAALVRAASGAMFVVVGGIALFLARSRAGPDRSLAAGLGLFACGFGGAFFLNNTALASASFPPAIVIGAVVALWVIAIVGVISASRGLVAPSARAAMLVLGIPLAAVFAISFGSMTEAVTEFYGFPPSLRGLFGVDVGAQYVATALSIALAFALAFEAPASGSRRRAHAALATGLLVYPAINAAATDLREAALLPVALYALVVSTMIAITVTSLAWCWTAARGAGRAAWLPAFAGPLVAIAANLATIEGLRGIDYLPGVVRAIGAALLALAIFRFDLFALGLRRRAAHRATGAAIALGALVITAEVAQTFFSARYGLLIGGVVAGALLFAAAPIQRALESGGDPGGDARLSTYREAVRYALRDGVVTRKEETHLAQLAQHLSIGAGDALSVRHEVEDERAVVKRNP